MRHGFTASVWREGEWFVAQGIEIEIASQGETEEESLANLQEAIELHMSQPVATAAHWMTQPGSGNGRSSV
ncbi:MAG: hypothetical protein AMXMBFR84_07170 [Candidatus Hydrogenedentota bacterium]